MTLKLNAKQLRSLESGAVSHELKSRIDKKEIYIVLDNVLDTYNIGSIFRLADAVAAKKIYLCQGSETPPNHRIKKASINTTEWVDWEYSESTTKTINDLRKTINNIQVVAIEQTSYSIAYDQFNYKLPIALVIGHESDGVSKDVLDLCDGVVELPMHGVNVSLNVMVSLGIVLYQVIGDTSS